MSGLQLEKYVEVRDIERERDKANQRSKDSKKALKARLKDKQRKQVVYTVFYQDNIVILYQDISLDQTP